GVALELLDPWDRGELGPVERPTRHDYKARLEVITAIGLDGPASGVIVPARFLDLRLEAGALIEVEVLSDPLGVLEDLRREGVLLLRYIAGLFEQRQIDVGFDIALGAGIAVPVPGPAEIPSLLDNTDLGDPDLLKPRRGQQPTKAATDDHCVEPFSQRRACEARIGVGVVIVVLERAGDFPVLIVTVRAQPLLTLGGILRAQRGRVEAQLFGCWNFLSFCLRYGFTHRSNLLLLTTLLSEHRSFFDVALDAACALSLHYFPGLPG